MFNFFKNKIDVLAALDTLVKGMKEGTKKSLENENYSSHTFYSYKSAVMNFKEFLNGKKINQDDLSKELMEAFNCWLAEKRFSKNSVWNNAKCIRTLLNRLVLDEVLPAINLGKLNVKKEVTTAVFNTEKEIEQLASLDLSLTEGLKRVRDLYVIQCYTGLRFGDLKKFMGNPKAYVKHTEEISYIDITTVKTSQSLIIPLKPIALKILEENNYKFGKPFSIQHYNNTLRNLAKHINFDDEIVRVRTIGGKRTETILKKHEMISSHTARRSFATNAYLSGISSLQIRRITGHTTEQSFLHYIRASGLENAITLLNHPFFK